MNSGENQPIQPILLMVAGDSSGGCTAISVMRYDLLYGRSITSEGMEKNPDPSQRDDCARLPCFDLVGLVGAMLLLL